MDSKSKSLPLILIITMSKIILLFIILDTVYFTVSNLSLDTVYFTDPRGHKHHPCFLLLFFYFRFDFFFHGFVLLILFAIKNYLHFSISYIVQVVQRFHF